MEDLECFTFIFRQGHHDFYPGFGSYLIAGVFKKMFVASFLSGEKGCVRLELQENVDGIHLGLREYESFP